MKKPIYKKWWFWVILVVVIGGIGSSIGGNSNGNKVEKSTTTQAKTEDKKEESKKEEKKYKLGETIKINDQYEITINKVNLTQKRNEFNDQKFKKVAVIEYTYKNLSVEGDLSIDDHFNFKAYDSEGNVLNVYPAVDLDNMSKPVGKGKKCTAQTAYGFNEGNKIELHFYDSMFNDKSDFVIELDNIK